MIRNISQCRVCKSGELESVMDLGEQTLTGVFPRNRNEKVTSGPLELVRCAAADGCGLVQLRQSYDLDEMYGTNYGYRSSLNPSMVSHLHSTVNHILSIGALEQGDLVIDIGSNDGTTLRAYPKGQYELVGVDPAGAKFAGYYTEDIQLIPDFFSNNSIRNVVGGKKAKVITSFSMFYDLEDPLAFAQEIKSTLHDNGIWIFEQSYLPSMLRANSFDTICHEHLEFYALKQINWIAVNAGLKIIDVELNDVNGGSFSITAVKSESNRNTDTKKIQQILADEKALGLDTSSAFDDFKRRVGIERRKLMEFLQNAKREGKRVCGLGASTKGNVLLQYYGIDDQLVSEIGEVNEDKFGSFTPGTLIRLLPEDQVLASNPDFLVILPWHFRNFFERHPKLKGRRLVFPLPYFEVVQT